MRSTHRCRVRSLQCGRQCVQTGWIREPDQRCAPLVERHRRPALRTAIFLSVQFLTDEPGSEQVQHGDGLLTGNGDGLRRPSPTTIEQSRRSGDLVPRISQCLDQRSDGLFGVLSSEFLDIDQGSRPATRIAAAAWRERPADDMWR